ncbi:hypothetical protein ACTL6P_17540 [Endozoicomonas acroporae]|uniref:hypothetical protein n=1 Tax=Endozoicomonas acroporae TaxID=1701104 RepID=UPI000C764596|nr:hypothetical protein [Endozoicomonas acroporae]
MQPAAGFRTSTDVDTAGNEIKPEVVRDMARFDHRWVRVPQEVFAKIASYLSISDIHNFGQASPTTGDRLRSCGLTEVHYFLSQSRQKQSSCRAIIQSRQQLLEHLRTLSIFSVRHFPAQLGPAFYSFYASHLRQQILDGAALTLIPSGSRNLNRSTRHLCDHIPILIERKSENYSNILALDHGHWVSKAEIKHDYFACFRHQHADHILFVPQSVSSGWEKLFSCTYSGKEHLLSVYECRNGAWVEQQQMTTGDVFPQCKYKYISNIYLSPDARSLVCINRGRAGAILGRGTDGQWVNKGNISTNYNHTLLFSADSKNLVLYHRSRITVMGQADDESWSRTADIIVEDRADDLELTPNDNKMSEYELNLEVVFSPDNRHFATWLSDDFDADAVRRDYFFVAIFALGPEGHWCEKKRIIKTCNPPSYYYHLKPNFSPDGRFLIITTQVSLDIWELNTDDQWLPAVQEKYQCGGGTIHFSADPCEFIRKRWRCVTIWRKAASGMWGRAQTFPAESLTKVSPNGETIVCNDPAGHTDIYQRKPVGELCAKPAGEWVRQRIEFSVEQVGFNQEGYLLAVVPETDSHSLILFGLTADGSWLERDCLQTETRIAKFCFSPCSRTLLVTSLLPDGDILVPKVVSFWQIRDHQPENAC